MKRFAIAAAVSAFAVVAVALSFVLSAFATTCELAWVEGIR